MESTSDIMCVKHLPNLPEVRNRLGTCRPAWIGLLPNLPNLPNLTARARVRTRTRIRARRMLYVILLFFRLGRLGRLGRTSRGNGFQVPNLAPNLRKVRKI